MKLYISADLEGVFGVVQPQHCNPEGDSRDYREAVARMAQELGWLCEAIWDVEEEAHIVINDAHCRMSNLEIRDLAESQRIELISGKPKSFAMMHGLDNSFDAAFLFGYHAKIGTQNGVLAHSFHPHIFDLTINGQRLGEFAVNSLYASLCHQVPVVFTSGDNHLITEAHAFLPNVAVIQTKLGLGFSTAQCESASTVEAMYFETVPALMEDQANWKNNLAAIEGRPFQLDLTVIDTLAADVVATLPIFKRLDGRTLRHTSDSFEETYRALQSAYSLFAYTNYLR